MTFEEFVVMMMAVGGFITVGMILVFLPSAHKREKKYEREHGEKERHWDPARGRYWHD